MQFIFLIKSTLFALLSLSLCFTSYTQPVNIGLLNRQALEYKRNFKDTLAIETFKKVLKLDPNNVTALHNTAYLLCNLAGRSNNYNDKRHHLNLAVSLSKQAVIIEPNNIEANITYTIAVAMITEIAHSPKEKLANVRLIKEQAEKIIKLAPNRPEGYFILGKWHAGIAALNSMEVVAANILYGGVPTDATFDDAIKYIQTAIRIHPEYILFQYNLAVTYMQMGEKSKATQVLQDTLQLRPLEPDDYIRLQMARELLRDLNKG